MSYIELQVTSNFSFLRGASHPDELMQQAYHYQYPMIGITDRNTLAGVVRMHKIAITNEMRAIIGCRIDLQDGASLLAYPTDVAAYGRLSKLLTLGKRRAPKGECHLNREDVYEASKGIKFIMVSPEDILEGFENDVKQYREAFGRNLSLAITPYYQGNDTKRFAWLSQLAKRGMIPLVGTNDVHYHHTNRRELQDVLTCIREKCTIKDAGYRLFANAERHLKTQEEMKRLFQEYPNAIKQTNQIAEACQFSLDELKYEYPDELTTDGRNPQQELEYQTMKGVTERIVGAVPMEVMQSVQKELALIEELKYAPYFLTVFDIVRFARSRNILCQGRGSAANSAVCYYLGITSVDPSKYDLLFERFISTARNEPPDIDVDFEHERREEVMQYVFQKYGRERAAIVGTIHTYHQKGVLQDVGKAMGLSPETMKGLSDTLLLHLEEWVDDTRLQERGLNNNDPYMQKVIELSGQLIGFPRHLSQHTGGFVITKGALSELCPILNAAMADRTCIEWNKDDIDDLGFMKIDVLSLGMLTCIRKGFDLIKEHYKKDYTLASIPQDEPETFAMISAADTIGVFQVESRAQMSMLPKLRPKCFYDIVIQVSLVRPGPIVGDLIHPYISRRNGTEKFVYPSKTVEKILGRTLGVPIFQEQAMKLAIECAGFTPTEADKLRKSMATFRADGTVSQFENKLVEGMLANGYTREFAELCFNQFKSFAHYGFPESHAASFAHLVYASAWIKCHYADVFACALLNSQPMGFYMPAQIVIDAKKVGVQVREVDINYSDWDNILEAKEERTAKYCPMRLGFRQIKGVRFDHIQHLIQMRGNGYKSITAIWQEGVTVSTLEALANADAFRSLGLDRRQALWEIKGLGSTPLEIFKTQKNEGIKESAVQLPLMSQGEHVAHDYMTTSLSLKAHPVSFLRDKLTRLGIVSAKDIAGIEDGKYIKVAGLVLVRQRPSTAQGVVFITTEDETGICNMIVWKKIVDEHRREILSSKFIMAAGTLQKDGAVTHLIVRSITDLTPMLKDISKPDMPELPLLVSRADEIKNGYRGSNHLGKAFPGSRDFK